MKFQIKDKRVILIDRTMRLVGDNQYEFEFEFDAEWEGKIKTARFIMGDYMKDIVLNDDKCLIEKTFFKGGQLKVGVYASNLATEVLERKVKSSILEEDGGEPTVPENLWTQLLEIIDADVQSVRQATSDAQNIVDGFGDVVKSKQEEFNTYAAEKQTEFNQNAADKIREYDEHITDYTTEINSLKDDLVNIDNVLSGNTVNYNLRGKLERGGIVSGNNYDGGTEYKKNHWRSKEFILDGYKDITIQSSDDNFTFKVWILSSMTGNYNDSGWVTQFEIDGNDKYRIAFGRVDEANFTEQDILSHISIVGTKSYTDKTLSIENVSADAKKTGTEIKKIKDFISYKKDISDEFTIHYGKNVYLVSGILYFENSNSLRCRTDLFNAQNKDILVDPKEGIIVNYYIEENGAWTEPLKWTTDAFYLPKNADVYLAFKKTDGSAFVENEPLVDFTEMCSDKTSLSPKFRLIHSISQELVVSDNNNESGAMQGMCFDGENIWYYLSSINSLRKYNINTKETTQYANLGLGHGNDITYNPNTRKLYIAVTDGTSPIVKTIDIDKMTVGEFELNEFDGSIASIAYSKETDEYVVIGGQAYDRDGNTDGWTRKQMVIYDKNFDTLKSFILQNDYSATQGVEFDGRYIYFCKSFYNGSHNDKVYVYDINGNIVNSFSSGTGEVEAISKIDDYNFYIARCENSYNGGYIYKATVTSESYTNIVDVLYEKYIN